MSKNMIPSIDLDDSLGAGEFRNVGAKGKPIMLHNNNFGWTLVFIGYEVEESDRVAEVTATIDKYKSRYRTADGSLKLPDVVDQSAEVLAWITDGADVNVTARQFVAMDKSDGNTALMVAIIHNQKQLVRLLIRHGADLNLKNAAGRTPRDMAKACASWGIRIMLWRKGAIR